MTIANATRKVEKAGFKVTQNPNNGQFYVARRDGFSQVVEFTRNGHSDDVATIRVRRESDKDDSMSDYCAGMFYDNIAQAIRAATR